MMRIATFIATILFPLLLLAGQSFQAPLPPEQAFAPSIYSASTKRAIVRWQIAPGYYLYQDQLQITLLSPQQGKITHINWPQGQERHNSVKGVYQAYFDSVRIPVQLQNVAKGDAVKLLVNYQGCSQSGFCYPPAQTTLAFTMGVTAVTDGSSSINSATSNVLDASASLVTDQHGITQLLLNQHWVTNIFIFMALGLLLSFTPCVLPMVPILSSIIIGQGAQLTTKKAFALSFAYVLGMALTYALAGLVAAWLGNSIQVALQKPVFIIVVSGLFVVLALSLFGWYEIRLPSKWQNYFYGFNQRQRGGHYLGVFLMGVGSTLIVSPCVSAPLVGVLTYIATTGNMALGGITLLALGIGMGIPLLVIGTSAGKWLPHVGPWMDSVKMLFGLLMLGMAVWLLSRVITTSMSLLLWILLCLSAVVLFFKLFSSRPAWRKLHKMLGVTLGVCGATLILGVETNQLDLTRVFPLSARQQQTEISRFIVVRDMAQLKHELDLAKLTNKPVMLDFYADWCVSCVEMDKMVWNDMQVGAALTQFVLLRADVTANDSSAQALMKYFNVIAPPTVIFFDSSGQELRNARVVGEIKAKEFLARLDNI